MASHKVIQLENNFIPKGLVCLEKLFDRNDVPTKPTVVPKDESIYDYNVGTSQEPKCIKLSKDIPLEVKNKFIELFKEYVDIFPCNMRT
jgi:hypothetical protein